ncbi:FAD-dependent oxidoreductase [uncultured Ruminococcus sp.]|uniref:FAD-dependent oxidoreductase n=1 Tax=uncultured Ruminococcus sp. TaxID=165186 RepID=UPI00345D482F
MKRYDMIVVGAGPAGLSAAIEAAKRGMQVVVYDENAKPGGQLFKQIHKFFGSKEHKAKIRGFHIGEAAMAYMRQRLLAVWRSLLSVPHPTSRRKSPVPAGVPQTATPIR